jgi:tripartite-type tricarboxylate transporter receptor subunit TctC
MATRLSFKVFSACFSSCLAVVAAIAAAPARADTFPEKPITIVVPFAAAGATDITARMVAERLGPMLNTSVIVENKAGANSQIGTGYVIHSKPDGYTLLMGTTSLINNVHLYPNIPYDASRALKPVIGVVDVPAFLLVSSKSPARTAREFIALAQKSDGKLNYASAGAGSSLHLAAEWFKQTVGFEATHIPQRGSGPAVQSLAQGDVDFSFENYGPALPQIQDHHIRVLAIGSPKRFPALPDVPTLHEAGLPDVDLASWFVLMAPSGTPDAVVTLLNQKINVILAQPDIRKRLIDLGLVPIGGTPESIATRMRQDSGKWGSIIRSANVKLE